MRLRPERIDRHNNGWVVSGPAYGQGTVGGTDHDLRPNNESHYIDRGKNQQPTGRPCRQFSVRPGVSLTSTKEPRRINQRIGIRVP